MFLGLLGEWLLAAGRGWTGCAVLASGDRSGCTCRAERQRSREMGATLRAGARSAVWGRSGGCWCAGPGSELSAGADGQPAPHAVLLVRR